MTSISLLLATLASVFNGDSISVSRVSGQYYQENTPPHSVDSFHISLPERTEKQHIKSILTTAGINLGILAFDRYVQKAGFSYVTWYTIGRNLNPSSWYWDSDNFRTNLLFHPYHGALYHNAARSNGIGFFEALPYTMGGSLMWEIAGESEHPSINDFIATSMGGWAIGEVSHRISERIYSNRSSGFERVFREIIGAVINPVGGLNRMITGKTFSREWVSSEWKDNTQIPLNLSIGMWGRCYGKGKEKTRWGSLLDIDIIYNTPTAQYNRKPYDFFRVRIGIDLTGGNSKVAHLNIIGQLKKWDMSMKNRSRLTLGLYQHFDYYSTDTFENHPVYKISEAAGFGAGLAWTAKRGNNIFQEEFYTNATLLGGALSDYSDNRPNRDYSVGSGYSLKSITSFNTSQLLRLRLSADMKHLFSWHGYEDEDNAKPYLEYNVMGDRGDIMTILLQPEISFSIYRNLRIATSGLWIYRNFRYKYHPHKSTCVTELRVGLQYHL